MINSLVLQVARFTSERSPYVVAPRSKASIMLSQVPSGYDRRMICLDALDHRVDGLATLLLYPGLEGCTEVPILCVETFGSC